MKTPTLVRRSGRPNRPTVYRINPQEKLYPPSLKEFFDHLPPLQAIGNPDLLLREKIGLVCSVRIPGRIILQTYEFAKHAAQEGPTMVGGFHSPMERQCLEIFLLRKVSLIVCLARVMGRRIRIPKMWDEALGEGRLLILSAANPGQRRATKAIAEERNRIVAGLSDSLLIPFASPGGKTDRLVQEAARRGKTLLTFGDPESIGLIAAGARIIR